MLNPRRLSLAVCLLSVLGPGTATLEAAQAQDETERNWSNSNELSWVVTSGNSDTNTFGVRNVYEYDWTSAELWWETGIVRAKSRDGERVALGSEDDFEIVEPDDKLDTNRLYSKVRYLRNISERFFWYGSFDSARDKPSNINRRFTPSAGVGNTWYERDGLLFRTTYGGTYTDEQLDLEGANRFAGYRLFYAVQARVTSSTEIESELTFDGSFERLEDTRVDSLNGVSVAISETIALKASLRLLLRNIPAGERIDLEDVTGAMIGEVVVPKQKLDTTFSTSLVINF